jgi:hypothetical protein
VCAVATNVPVRLVARDDARQVAARLAKAGERPQFRSMV